MIRFVNPPPAARWTVARSVEADSLAALDLHDAAIVHDDLHRSEAETAQGPEHRRAEHVDVYKVY
jgi:hypothetical protein